MSVVVQPFQPDSKSPMWAAPEPVGPITRIVSTTVRLAQYPRKIGRNEVPMIPAAMNNQLVGNAIE